MISFEYCFYQQINQLIVKQIANVTNYTKLEQTDIGMATCEGTDRAPLPKGKVSSGAGFGRQAIGEVGAVLGGRLGDS